MQNPTNSFESSSILRSSQRLTVAYIVENTVGCKWALPILESIRQGVCRPGAITRSIDGLTTKVLNERLSDMVRFGILKKIAYPEIPPRVEYELTDFGQRFVVLLDIIQDARKLFRESLWRCTPVQVSSEMESKCSTNP